MEWTDDRIEILRRLWRDGLSAGQIAQRLDGATRNAVLGKLSRLKLLGSRPAASPPGRAPAQPTPPVPAGALAAWVRAEPDWPELDVPDTAFAPLPGARPRPWLSRTPEECAFPAGGDGAAMLACCAPVQARSAYCATHHARVYRPSSPTAELAPQGPRPALARPCAA